MTFEVIVQQFRCRRERLEPNPAAEIDTWSHPASRGKIAGYTQAEIEPFISPNKSIVSLLNLSPVCFCECGHLLVKALVEPRRSQAKPLRQIWRRAAEGSYIRLIHVLIVRIAFDDAISPQAHTAVVPVRVKRDR